MVETDMESCLEWVWEMLGEYRILLVAGAVASRYRGENIEFNQMRQVIALYTRLNSVLVMKKTYRLVAGIFRLKMLFLFKKTEKWQEIRSRMIDSNMK